MVLTYIQTRNILTSDSRSLPVLVWGWIWSCMRKRLPVLTYIQTRHILTSGLGLLPVLVLIRLWSCIGLGLVSGLVLVLYERMLTGPHLYTNPVYNHIRFGIAPPVLNPMYSVSVITPGGVLYVYSSLLYIWV